MSKDEMTEGGAKESEELEKRLKALVRPVKGFPNPDFVFGDITPLLADGPAFGEVIDAFAARYKDAVLVNVAYIFKRRLIECFHLRRESFKPACLEEEQGLSCGGRGLREGLRLVIVSSQPASA